MGGKLGFIKRWWNRPYRTLWRGLGIHAVEYKAHARTVKIHGQRVYLSLPYIQFIKIWGVLFVTCSRRPVWTPFHIVYWLPLPNIYSRYRVCMPGVRRYSDLGRQVPYVFGMARSIESFFISPFNGDYDGRIMPREIPNFRQWEIKSKGNPDFARSATWRGARPFLLALLRCVVLFFLPR